MPPLSSTAAPTAALSTTPAKFAHQGLMVLVAHTELADFRLASRGVAYCWFGADDIDRYRAVSASCHLLSSRVYVYASAPTYELGGGRTKPSECAKKSAEKLP